MSIIKNLSVLIATFVLLVCGSWSLADEEAPYPRILVSGEGSVDIAPDMAVLSLMVTREAATARAALDANASAMTGVLAAMREQGIAERDLQTSKFSIQPRYHYPKQQSAGEQRSPKIVGYTVRNGLTVRVRDISQVGEVLDSSVTLGVNEGGNILFTNDDPSSAITLARTNAMHDAMAKANTLAQAAGVKTGKLLEISEQSYRPRPMPMARTEMAMMSADSGGVSVAAGENTYKVTVNVSFAIEQ
jgi:uncharacterized protein YggE